VGSDGVESGSAGADSTGSKSSGAAVPDGETVESPSAGTATTWWASAWSGSLVVEVVVEVIVEVAVEVASPTVSAGDAAMAAMASAVSQPASASGPGAAVAPESIEPLPCSLPSAAAISDWASVSQEDDERELPAARPTSAAATANAEIATTGVPTR
jgi:hypothetical protein